MKKLLQSKRDGSTIALSMVAIILLLVMGVGLMTLGLNRRIYSVRNASDIKARCAADAGLVMALFEMNDKLETKPWNGDTLPQATNVSLPYCDAVFSYEVTGDLGSGYTIESVGTSGLASRTVRSTIGLSSPFNYAILTKGTLTLKSGTTVNGYNSLDSADLDTSSVIGSQSSVDSSVILNMGSTVEGDVFVSGNLDSAIKDLGATVTGEKFISAPDPLPGVTAPTLSNKGSISAAGETLTITPADSGAYSSIDLQQADITEEVVTGKGKKLTTEIVVVDTVPAVLQVSGGHVTLHVTGDIQLGNSCEIVVAEGSSLTIYSDGDIHCRNGSGINTENPPEAADTLQIYATGVDPQYFDIKAKSEFTGIIYAPDADVDLYANGDVYGSIVAQDFEFKAGGNFKYDRALQKKNTVNDEAVQFVVTRFYDSSPHFAMSD